MVILLGKTIHSHWLSELPFSDSTMYKGGISVEEKVTNWLVGLWTFLAANEKTRWENWFFYGTHSFWPNAQLHLLGMDKIIFVCYWRALLLHTYEKLSQHNKNNKRLLDFSCAIWNKWELLILFKTTDCTHPTGSWNFVFVLVVIFSNCI